MVLDFGQQLFRTLFTPTFEDDELEEHEGSRKFPVGNKGGISASSQSSTFTTTNLSSSYSDISGASVSVTVAAGEGVLVLMSTDVDMDTADGGVFVRLLRDSTVIGNTGGMDIDGDTGRTNIALQYFENPSAGTYTYKVQGLSQTNDGDVLGGLLTVIVFHT